MTRAIRLLQREKKAMEAICAGFTSTLQREGG